MRLLLPLLALALAAGGCRFEPRAEAPDPPPSAAPGALAGAVPDGVAEPVRPPQPAVAPDGRPEVVLYVTEWCPYCQQAREFMTAEGVPHRVVDIEASAENQREYQARGGQGGIPLVAVGAETIEGWSAPVAREMLDAAGYD